MSDRWGPDGPPDEAYSRVTRDLAQVTAGFAAYLDVLPRALATAFDCRVRPLTAAESARLARGGGPATGGYAVEPVDPASATLLVDRWTFEGGAAVTLGFGRADLSALPVCFCDACDEDSAGLIEQAREYVEVATGAVTEFRRAFDNPRGVLLDGDGPWLEQGYRSARTSSWGASEGVRGDLFEIDWLPWGRRV